MKSDLVVLLMTFVTGILAGSYIYFTGFREIDFEPREPQAAPSSFSIAVSMYGGCAMVGICPSYRFDETGAFQLFTDTRSGVEERLSGQVPQEWLQRVESALATIDLQAQSTPQEYESCAAWLDGIDFEYNITVAGEQFRLDTCGTAVDVDNELIETLDELFEVLPNLAN